MAKIVSQKITLIVSKAVKDDVNIEFSPLSDEITNTLETVVAELINDNGCVIEVQNNE